MKQPTPAQASLLGLKPSELAVIEKHDLLSPDRTVGTDTNCVDAHTLRRSTRSPWQRPGVILAAVSLLCVLALAVLLLMLLRRS